LDFFVPIVSRIYALYHNSTPLPSLLGGKNKLNELIEKYK